MGQLIAKLGLIMPLKDKLKKIFKKKRNRLITAKNFLKLFSEAQRVVNFIKFFF